MDPAKEGGAKGAHSPRQGLRKILAGKEKEHGGGQRVMEYVAWMLGLEERPTRECAKLLVGYCVLSSGMLVLNKKAVAAIPDSPTLLLLQLGTATAGLLAFNAVGAVRPKLNIDPGPRAAGAWLLVALGFLASIFCSMQTLKHGTVGWYMVLHYVEPIGVSLADWLVIRRERPELKSMVSLLIMLVWSLGYALHDHGKIIPSSMAGVGWGVAWLLVMMVYLTFTKATINAHKAISAQERVLYANGLSFALLVAALAVRAQPGSRHQLEHLGIGVPEPERGLPGVLGETQWGDVSVLGVVLLSSACGGLLSYVRLSLMAMISAAAYAQFAVVALFPVRVWQALSRVG